MKFLASAAFAALLSGPAVLSAQTAPAAPATSATPAAGATIYDSAGVAVGAIDQVTPQAVVVTVDGAKVSLPPASIGSGPQGLRIALTRAEVVAAARQAQAGAQQQLLAQLTPGATVRGSAGAVVGTVKATDAQGVTLTTANGDVKLPMSGFGMGASGPVIGMTAAELDAAVAQAGGVATAPAGADAAAAADVGATPTGAATVKSTTTTRPRRRAR